MDRKRKPANPCIQCGFSESFCICSELRPLKLKTRVDLLVHYKELKRTSNTGRLIGSLLENQKIWVRGEKNNPLDHKIVLDSNCSPVLLFPSDEAIVATKESLKILAKNKPLQVLVPDGNWRQASKVHYRVAELKEIPRITLLGEDADRTDLLRKETKDEGMSTLEAIAHLLGLIEGDTVKDHILKAYKLKKSTQLKSRGQ